MAFLRPFTTQQTSQADYNNVRSYNADNMPISSAPRLLALYLLQLLGLSTKQLEELKVSDWVNRLLDN